MSKANFDPFVGRKLYSYAYDLQLSDIAVEISAHHNIYGKIQDSDLFNWRKKLEIAPQKVGYKFEEFEGGFKEFREELENFLLNHRRFIYTPVICCKACKAGY